VEMCFCNNKIIKLIPTSKSLKIKLVKRLIKKISKKEKLHRKTLMMEIQSRKASRSPPQDLQNSKKQKFHRKTMMMESSLIMTYPIMFKMKNS